MDDSTKQTIDFNELKSYCEKIPKKFQKKIDRNNLLFSNKIEDKVNRLMIEMKLKRFFIKTKARKIKL